MLISGPEQKPIARLSPDGSQILYLQSMGLESIGGAPASRGSNQSQVQRLLRAPVQGGSSQEVRRVPISSIFNVRARLGHLRPGQAQPREYIFSSFDIAKGSLRQVAKLDEAPSG